TVPETRKILLWVNDEPSMSQERWDWLQQRGGAILAARSTAHAMELLERARCDAVITNLRRDEGGGKNNNAGVDLTQRIRRVHPHLPVLIYTMNIDVATRQLAFSSGATLI